MSICLAIASPHRIAGEALQQQQLTNQLWSRKYMAWLAQCLRRSSFFFFCFSFFFFPDSLYCSMYQVFLLFHFIFLSYIIFRTMNTNSILIMLLIIISIFARHMPGMMLRCHVRLEYLPTWFPANHTEKLWLQFIAVGWEEYTRWLDAGLAHCRPCYGIVFCRLSSELHPMLVLLFACHMPPSVYRWDVTEWRCYKFTQ